MSNGPKTYYPKYQLREPKPLLGKHELVFRDESKNPFLTAFPLIGSNAVDRAVMRWASGRALPPIKCIVQAGDLIPIREGIHPVRILHPSKPSVVLKPEHVESVAVYPMGRPPMMVRVYHCRIIETIGDMACDAGSRLWVMFG